MTDIFHGARTEKQLVRATNLSTNKLEERDVEFMTTGSTRHIFLADHFSEFGRQYNPFAIELLKSWLAFFQPNCKFDPLEKVQTISSAVISRFVQNIKHFEIQKDRLVPKLERPDEPVKLTAWQLDTTRGITFAFDGGSMYEPKVCILIVTVTEYFLILIIPLSSILFSVFMR